MRKTSGKEQEGLAVSRYNYPILPLSFLFPLNSPIVYIHTFSYIVAIYKYIQMPAEVLTDLQSIGESDRTCSVGLAQVHLMYLWHFPIKRVKSVMIRVSVSVSVYYRVLVSTEPQPTASQPAENWSLHRTDGQQTDTTNFGGPSSSTRTSYL